MVRNELLSKVPLLVLANKQDLPECMGVREVKPIFNQSAHLIGSRGNQHFITSHLNK